MEIIEYGKIKATEKRHRAGVSSQTGFPSPATHYAEPTVDLTEVLVKNKEATFFVRVRGNNFNEYNIYDKDVLIIDRSLPPISGKLALLIKEGEFKVDKVQEASQLWGMITYIIHSVS